MPGLDEWAAIGAELNKGASWENVAPRYAERYSWQGGSDTGRSDNVNVNLGANFKPALDNYWQNPQNVATHYMAWKALPDYDWSWLNTDLLERSYNYLSTFNKGLDWFNWKALPAEDPYMAVLGSMPAPPDNEKWDLSKLSEQDKTGLNSILNMATSNKPLPSVYTYYNPDMGVPAGTRTNQLIKTPNGIVQSSWQELLANAQNKLYNSASFYSPSGVAATQIVANPQLQNDLPSWMNTVAGIMNSPLLQGITTMLPIGMWGMGAGAVTGLGAMIVGGATTFPLLPVLAAAAIPLLIGAGLGLASDPNSYEKLRQYGMSEQTAENLQTLATGTIWLANQGYEWAERAIFAGWTIATEDEQADLDKMLANIREKGLFQSDIMAAGRGGWEVALSRYTQAQNIPAFIEYMSDLITQGKSDVRFAQPGKEIWVLGKGEPVPIEAGTVRGEIEMAFNAISSGQKTSEESLVDIKNKYGLSGDIGDLAAGILFDPINFFGPAQSVPIGVAGKLTGNSALAKAAFHSARHGQGAISTLRNYSQDLRYTGTAAELSTKFSKRIAGLVENDGTLKFKELEKSEGRKAFIGWFDELSKQSKADAMGNLAADLANVFISMGSTKEDVGGILKAWHNMNPAESAVVGKLLQTPAAQTAAPALKGIMAPYQKMVGMWDAGESSRTLLGTIAERMNKTLQKTVDMLREGEPDAIYTRVLNSISDPTAKQALASDPAFTPETIAAAVDWFVTQKQPYNFDNFKANVIDMVETHATDWAVKHYGVTPRSGAYRFFGGALKTFQSILLLGLNPLYLVNNIVNNTVTAVHEGVFGYTRPAVMNAYFEKLGLKQPRRFHAGIGPADLDAATDASKIMRKASRGHDSVQALQDFMSGVGSKMPALKGAQSAEILARTNSYFNGMRQVIEREWRKGGAIPDMPGELRNVLNSIHPELAKTIETLIADARSTADLDAIFKEAVLPAVKKSITPSFEKAAAHVGLSEADLRQILNDTNIGEVVQSQIAKGAHPEDAMNVAEKMFNDDIDRMRRLDIGTRVEDVAQKLDQEGMAAGLDIIRDLWLEQENLWIRHFAEWTMFFKEVDQLKKMGAHYDVISKRFDGKFAQQQKEWSRLKDWNTATWEAILAKFGVDDINPTTRVDGFAKWFMDEIEGMNGNWNEFYTKAQELRKAFFETAKAEGWDTGVRKTEWTQMQKELADLYGIHASSENAFMIRAGDAFTKFFEARFDVDKAKTAHDWWMSMLNAGIERQRLMTDFRAFLRGEPTKGLSDKVRALVKGFTPDQAPQLWNKFLGELYLPHIANTTNLTFDYTARMFNEIMGRSQVELTPVERLNSFEMLRQALETFRPSDPIDLMLWRAKVNGVGGYPYNHKPILNLIKESLSPELKEGIESGEIRKLQELNLPTDDLRNIVETRLRENATKRSKEFVEDTFTVPQRVEWRQQARQMRQDVQAARRAAEQVPPEPMPFGPEINVAAPAPAPIEFETVNEKVIPTKENIAKAIEDGWETFGKLSAKTTKAPVAPYAHIINNPLSQYLGRKASLFKSGVLSGLFHKSVIGTIPELWDVFTGSGMEGLMLADSLKVGKLVMTEANRNIYLFHKVVKENPAEILRRLIEFRDQIDVMYRESPTGGLETYNKVLEWWKGWRHPADGASEGDYAFAGFLAGAGGFTRSGEFNLMTGAKPNTEAGKRAFIPYNWNTTKIGYDAIHDRIMQHSKNLNNNNADIRHVQLKGETDEYTSLTLAPGGVIATLDPPYVPPPGRSVVAGYADGKYHMAIANAINYLETQVTDAHNRGVGMLYTNYPHEDLVKWFADHSDDWDYLITEVTGANGKRDELVAWNTHLEQIGGSRGRDIADRAFRKSDTRTTGDILAGEGPGEVPARDVGTGGIPETGGAGRGVGGGDTGYYGLFRGAVAGEVEVGGRRFRIKEPSPGGEPIALREPGAGTDVLRVTGREVVPLGKPFDWDKAIENAQGVVRRLGEHQANRASGYWRDRMRKAGKRVWEQADANDLLPPEAVGALHRLGELRSLRELYTKQASPEVQRWGLKTGKRYPPENASTAFGVPDGQQVGRRFLDIKLNGDIHQLDQHFTSPFYQMNIYRPSPASPTKYEVRLSMNHDAWHEARLMWDHRNSEVMPRVYKTGVTRGDDGWSYRYSIVERTRELDVYFMDEIGRYILPGESWAESIMKRDVWERAGKGDEFDTLILAMEEANDLIGGTDSYGASPISDYLNWGITLDGKWRIVNVEDFGALYKRRAMNEAVIGGIENFIDDFGRQYNITYSKLIGYLDNPETIPVAFEGPAKTTIEQMSRMYQMHKNELAWAKKQISEIYLEDKLVPKDVSRLVVDNKLMTMEDIRAEDIIAQHYLDLRKAEREHERFLRTVDDHIRMEAEAESLIDAFPAKFVDPRDGVEKPVEIYAVYNESLHPSASNNEKMVMVTNFGNFTYSGDIRGAFKIAFIPEDDAIPFVIKIGQNQNRSYGGRNVVLNEYRVMEDWRDRVPGVFPANYGLGRMHDSIMRHREDPGFYQMVLPMLEDSDSYVRQQAIDSLQNLAEYEWQQSRDRIANGRSYDRLADDYWAFNIQEKGTFMMDKIAREIGIRSYGWGAIDYFANIQKRQGTEGVIKKVRNQIHSFDDLGRPITEPEKSRAGIAKGVRWANIMKEMDKMYDALAQIFGESDFGKLDNWMMYDDGTIKMIDMMSWDELDEIYRLQQQLRDEASVVNGLRANNDMGEWVDPRQPGRGELFYKRLEPETFRRQRKVDFVENFYPIVRAKDNWGMVRPKIMPQDIFDAMNKGNKYRMFGERPVRYADYGGVRYYETMWDITPGYFDPIGGKRYVPPVEGETTPRALPKENELVKAFSTDDPDVLIKELIPTLGDDVLRFFTEEEKWQLIMAQPKEKLNAVFKKTAEDNLANSQDGTNKQLNFEPFGPLVPGTIDTIGGPRYMSNVASEGMGWWLRPVLDALHIEEQRKRLTKGLPEGTSIPPETQAQLKAWIDSTVKPELARTKLRGMKLGEHWSDRTLLDYRRRTNMDDIFNIGVPYHFWWTHSLVEWALRSMDKPAFFAHLSKLARFGMTADEERYPTPTRLQGKWGIPVPYLQDWAGGRVWIDPIGKFFPIMEFLRPFERLGQQENRVNRGAEFLIQDWMRNGSIDQDEALYAIQSRSGTVWDQAVQISKQEEGVDMFDYMSMFVSPALWLTIPNKILRGEADEIDPLPMSRTIQSLATATGIEGLRRLDLEAALRKGAGLSTFGKWGDWYIDRQLSNMAVEMPEQTNEIIMAMISKEGPLYEQALQRVQYEMMMRVPGMMPIKNIFDKKGLGNVLGSMVMGWLPSGMLPDAELHQRGIKPEYDAAWQAYNSGDKTALDSFWAKYPEYEARLALYDEPEERLRNFLKNEVWDGWYRIEDQLTKDAVVEQLGPDFETKFLDSETRDYNSIDLQTMATWANMLGGQTPNTIAPAEGFKLDLPDPSIAKKHTDYINMRDALFPDVLSVQGAYWDAEGNPQVQDSIMANSALSAYWSWQDDVLAENPDLIPYLISESSSLYGVDPQTQLLVYQFRSARHEQFPNYYELQDVAYNESLSKKTRDAAWDQLNKAFEWERSVMAQYPQIVPYVRSAETLAKYYLGKDYISEYNVKQSYDLSSLDPSSQRELLNYYTADVAPTQGTLDELYLLWEDYGKPEGNFNDWMEYIRLAYVLQ